MRNWQVGMQLVSGMLRWLLVGALAWTASMASVQAAGDKPGAYGRKLVEVYELPADVLAQFARFVPSKTDNPATIFAKTVDWVGTELPLSTGGNPYTIVIKVTGTAVEAGDAKAYFQPGWVLPDSGKRSNGVLTVEQSVAKAGALVQRTFATPPISVKDDKPMAPYVGFSAASNLNVTGVTVEVWSGMPKSSLASLLMAWSPLLLGGVFLGLFLWWRR